jgi:hypothetical protein
MLLFLEYFSILLTALAGILALLTEFKTQKGQVTKWGKIALSGVLVTALVSTSVKFFKDRDAEDKAIREIARANASLFLIKKSLYPLREFRTEAEVSYSLNHPYLIGYAPRFRQIANTLRQHPDKKDQQNYYGVDIFSRTEKNINNWMRIYPNAKIIEPSMESRNARGLLDHLQLIVRIHSNPKKIAVDQLDANSLTLNFTYYGRVFDPTEEYRTDATIIKSGSLLYNFSEDRFYVSAPDMPQELTYIRNNATSFLDLLNSTIVVRNPGVGAFTKNSRIELISLITPQGHELRFQNKHFSVMNDEYSYYFMHHTASDEKSFFEAY